jgi:hypothetical protein
MLDSNTIVNKILKKLEYPIFNIFSYFNNFFNFNLIVNKFYSIKEFYKEKNLDNNLLNYSNIKDKKKIFKNA